MYRSFKSASSHTIVLIQFNLERSRSYYDYETLSEALNGICSLYEARLKFKNPNKPNITYSIAELFEWMDKMTDISCLVFKQDILAYVPHDRQWLKDKIFHHIRRQAQ